MPARRKLPDTDELIKMTERGMTYQEIADKFQATKGAVYLQLARAGRTAERPRYEDFIPWRVRTEHQNAYPVQMLRLLARREAGEELDPVRARMLDAWLENMAEQGAVVDYDPDLGPYDAPGLRTGGWRYRARRRGDLQMPPIRPPKKPRRRGTTTITVVTEAEDEVRGKKRKPA